MKDYYKILGLDPAVETEVIAAAYNALAEKYRPQHTKYPGAEERMKDIDEAYEVLNDPQKKAEYDRMRQEESARTSLPSSEASPEGPGKNKWGYSEYSNSQDGARVIIIPAGDFLMGSPQGEGSDDEHPQRTVSLDDYGIYKYEVTNGQFARFVNDAGYRAEGPWKKYSVPGRENHPVVNVTWNDARSYCQWAGGRLPTEAEWEKSARGTDGRLYPWGNSWDRNKCNNVTTDSQVFMTSRAKLRQGRGTTPAGTFLDGASPYGCMDMAGNVWEWCNDWYDGEYYEKSLPKNPAGALDGETRVFRGGAWNNDATTGFRCAYRASNKPMSISNLYGFRVCIPVVPRG